MNFRALNIREAHERPEAMEKASVMMVGLNPERILQGLVQLLQYQLTGSDPKPLNPKPLNSQLLNPSTSKRNFRLVADYSMPNVSDKVVKVILSYTTYIKRTVWNEE
jgi:UDP-N-acetylglucosamine 2-epimerase (non-hydrolysing)